MQQLYTYTNEMYTLLYYWLVCKRVSLFNRQMQKKFIIFTFKFQFFPTNGYKFIKVDFDCALCTVTAWLLCRTFQFTTLLLMNQFLIHRKCQVDFCLFLFPCRCGIYVKQFNLMKRIEKIRKTSVWMYIVTIVPHKIIIVLEIIDKMSKLNEQKIKRK